MPRYAVLSTLDWAQWDPYAEAIRIQASGYGPLAVTRNGGL